MRLVGIATRPADSRVVKLKDARRDGKTEMAVHELSVLDEDSGRQITAQSWTDADAPSPFDGLTRGDSVDLTVGKITTYGDSVRADIID